MRSNYNIPVVLLVLVLGISYLSYYNYKTQKNLLLTQMQNNSLNIVSSVSAAIERFGDIKSTMDLQKLLDDISFELEIFEFRFLEADGTIKNSMFKNEVGSIYDTKSFRKAMQGDLNLEEFFFEKRDFVRVMAIYYPIYRDNNLVGMIDLAVDISEYKALNGSTSDFSVLRRQVDVMNLLKAIEGSILNSLDIFKKTDMYDFLHSYVNSTKNIVQISLIDSEKNVVVSSDKGVIGSKVKPEELQPSSLVKKADRLVHRTIVDENIHQNAHQDIKDMKDMKLMFLIDASNYESHEQQLLQTAVLTSVIALFFALFTSWIIYYSTVNRSRKEKERLELLVKERTKEIELLSKTDALTGLWNRGYLEEMLEMEFKRARRNAEDVTIMIIDLDHFKNVNDTYGHMAGDEILRITSEKISESIRETDFIGRFGGEEFVVILPSTSLEEGINVAQSIRKAIAAEAVMFEGNAIPVTTSIGISNLRDDHENYLMIFAEADEALYKAKDNGRNRVEVFSKQENA